MTVQVQVPIPLFSVIQNSTVFNILYYNQYNTNILSKFQYYSFRATPYISNINFKTNNVLLWQYFNNHVLTCSPTPLDLAIQYFWTVPQGIKYSFYIKLNFSYLDVTILSIIEKDSNITSMNWNMSHICKMINYIEQINWSFFSFTSTCVLLQLAPFPYPYIYIYIYINIYIIDKINLEQLKVKKVGTWDPKCLFCWKFRQMSLISISCTQLSGTF